MSQNAIQSALDLARKITEIKADIDRGFTARAASDLNRLTRDLALITALETEITDLVGAIGAISQAIDRGRDTVYPDNRPPNSGLLTGGVDRPDAETLLETLTVALYKCKALLSSKRDQLSEERREIEDRQCRRGDHARVVSYADGRQALTLSESRAIASARSRGDWESIGLVEDLCTRPMPGPTEDRLDAQLQREINEETAIEQVHAQKVNANCYRRSRGGRRHHSAHGETARNKRLLRVL